MEDLPFSEEKQGGLGSGERGDGRRGQRGNCSGDIKKDKEESVMDKEVRDWSSFALEPEDLI